MPASSTAYRNALLELEWEQHQFDRRVLEAVLGQEPRVPEAIEWAIADPKQQGCVWMPGRGRL